MSTTRSLAKLLHLMAKARRQKAIAEINDPDNQTSWEAEWRFAMTVQKNMAEVEMEALDKVMKESGVTHSECPFVIGADDASGIICNNINSVYYQGDCNNQCI